ncbi:YhjD/YihY/BrkB family envelope integrity protein [Mycoplasma sp. 480]|uniref:YhjD/YihY/BrkB family envelope integrity protein n=1 Tax=Mycoplasma sp. 480 TaxID=3440155 RepID=UPI003F515482
MKNNNWFKDKLIKKKNKFLIKRLLNFFILIILKISIRPKTWKTRKDEVKTLVSRSINKLASVEFAFLPPGFAFYLFVSFIPILIISFSIISSINFGWFSNNLENLKDFLLEQILNRYIPGINNSIPKTLNIFSSTTWETTTFILLLISSLWIASSGYAKFISSQSVIYNHKNTGNIFLNRLKGILIVIIISTILSLFLSVSSLIFISLKSKIEEIWLYDLSFYLISIIFLFMFFYITWLITLKISPVFKISFKQILPGTFISALSSTLFSIIFGFLASAKFINYDKFGTLATFLYLSTFCLYISYLLYFGVIINEAFYKSLFSQITKHKYKFQKTKI